VGAPQRVAFHRYGEPKRRQTIVLGVPETSDAVRLHVCHDTPDEAGGTMANPGYF
jgi:hypothetical protein